MQGLLGDCWLVSSIAAVARNFNDIYKIFGQQTVNAAGIYSLNLYSIGIPVTVVIDDFIPVNNSLPLFTKLSAQNEIWPVLLEKAIAKLIGNYDLLIAGNSNDAINSLLGAPGAFYTNSTKTTATIWTDL